MILGIDPVLALAYLLAGLTVIFGLMAIESPKLMRATFYFGLFAVLLGEIYILLGAEFIGVIQILVYAGGIAILVVFSLMFIPRTETTEEIPYASHVRAIIGAILIALFVGSIGYFEEATEGGIVSMEAISSVFIEKYPLAIVLVMVLLFVTIISATYLAVEEGSE